MEEDRPPSKQISPKGSGNKASVQKLLKHYSRYLIWSLVGIATGFGVACIIFGSSFRLIKQQTYDSYKWDDHVSRQLFKEIDLKTLVKYREWIGSNTGSGRSEEMITNWIISSFKSLDFCFTSDYQVLLSFEDSTNPSKVEGIDGAGNIIFSSNTHFNHNQKNNRQIAFSARKSIESNSLIYANYGRKEDFDYLRSLGIGIVDKLIILRYGEISLGSKILNAQEFDVKGLIIMEDFPNSVREVSVSHGPGLLIPDGGRGDPLSPGWSSVEGAVKLHEPPFFPRIPVFSVNMEIARSIMSKLGGRDTPNDWIGRIKGIRYKIGGEFLPSEELQRVKLHVGSSNELASIKNVVGIIKGSIEPDRYVVFGSHRADGEGSGVSALVKLARSFTEAMKKKNWRPRRSILFVSWAAHEFGLVGSTEWVEENLPLLKNRLVAYINFDNNCHSGSLLRPIASPGMSSVLFKSAKKLKDPDNPKRSYFESKMKGSTNIGHHSTSMIGSAAFPEMSSFFKDEFSTRDHQRREIEDDGYFEGYSADDVDTNLQSFNLLGSNNDHYPFSFLLNAPSINVRSTNPSNLQRETPLEVQMKNLQLCIRYSSDMIRHLADSILLPFDPKDYAIILRSGIDHFRSNHSYSRTFSTRGISFSYLDQQAIEFEKTANNWTNYVKNQNYASNPLLARMINDQLLQLPTLFSQYDPNRNTTTNILFGPDMDPSNSVPFPRLRADTIQLMLLTKQSNGDIIDDEGPRVEDLVFRTKKHITDLLIAVKNGIKQLRDFTYIH